MFFAVDNLFSKYMENVPFSLRVLSFHCFMND